MTVDLKWFERNVGFNPLTTPTPAAAWANARAERTRAPEDLQREIIDFDSEAPTGLNFLAFSRATGLSRFKDIPWPRGLAPVTQKLKAKRGSPLPRADALVVTWTMDEGHALSRVLTPGKDSSNDYLPYTHNYARIAKKMRAGCPARDARRLGTYWTTRIGSRSVVVFKSDSHMSQDGPQLPNADVWRQIIEETHAPLVLTTGTSGGIGKTCEVGDVIVSPLVRFDCQSTFKNRPFAHAQYVGAAPATTRFAMARTLFKANAGQLPPDNKRPPAIRTIAKTDLNAGVLTTDFFGFDTSDNHYHLQHLGSVSEMGDAVLGMVAKQMGAKAPKWLAVRNVSDPQIKSVGTLKQQANEAADIYKAFGRWSSVCSAIVCWALIAAEN